jgi:hypothetical protein
MDQVQDHVQWRCLVLSVANLLNLLPTSTLCLLGLIVPGGLVKYYVKELQVSNLGWDTGYLDFFLFFSFNPSEGQNIILKQTATDFFEILMNS